MLSRHFRVKMLQNITETHAKSCFKTQKCIKTFTTCDTLIALIVYIGTSHSRSRSWSSEDLHHVIIHGDESMELLPWWVMDGAEKRHKPQTFHIANQAYSENLFESYKTLINVKSNFRLFFGLKMLCILCTVHLYRRHMFDRFDGVWMKT